LRVVRRSDANFNKKLQLMIEKMDVEGLLKHTESLSDCSIKVGISKSKLTLTGMVHTLDQKGEAERIAWKALGVWSVANEIVIG
jgi:osmotically-inducible protein OsmY